MKVKAKASFLWLSVILLSVIVLAYWAVIKIELEQADNLVKRDQWNLAIEKYNQVLQKQPNNIQALASRGLTYGRLAKFQDALADLERSIELDPDNGEAWMNRSLVYYQMEQTKQAKREAERALALIKVPPTEPAKKLDYAVLLSIISKDKEAKCLFSEVLKDTANKQDLESLIYSARASRGLDRHKDAARYLTEAIKIDSNNYALYSRRASAYFNQSLYAQARSDLDRAIKLYKAPYNFSARAYLNYLEAKEKEALQDYNAAVELNPGSTILYLWRAKTYSALNDYTNALKDLDKGLSLDPENAELHKEKCLVYLWQNKGKDALTEINKALALDPDLNSGHLVRAQAQFNQNNYQEAMADLGKELSAKPKDSLSLFWRGLTYRELKNYDAAINDFTNAIAIYKEDPKYFCARGAAYASKHEYDQAIVDCTQSIAIAPERAHPYLTRGLSYARLGRYHLALRDLSQAIKKWPEYGDAYYQRSLVHRKLGMRANAEADLKAATTYGYGDPAAMQAL